jgi:hypothetical protein
MSTEQKKQDLAGTTPDENPTSSVQVTLLARAALGEVETALRRFPGIAWGRIQHLDAAEYARRMAEAGEGGGSLEVSDVLSDADDDCG